MSRVEAGRLPGAHRTPLGSSALCDSNKCFNCAKAKRQQQMF
ncbi:hypothetical protein [Bacillus sp. RS11]